MSSDIGQQLCEQVHDASKTGTPLSIRGGQSKRFFANEVNAIPLDVSGHYGITGYEPTELVITARAGTLLADIKSSLENSGQMLAFEPPSFGADATLGGTIATGLSGPRRPFNGAARDFVLGVRCINGNGESLRFGGEVIKNVAGYDVARLMTGALGTLGVITEVSLKVLPKPRYETTLIFEFDLADSFQRIPRWLEKPMPVSALCFDQQRLWLRLSGTEEGVKSAIKRLGGENATDASQFWHDLNEQKLDFFAKSEPLWRISVPANSRLPEFDKQAFLDWGGAQRWLHSERPAPEIQDRVSEVGGHATLFRGVSGQHGVFQPLPAEMLALHKRLKQAFDPRGVLNPGRMYAGI